MSIKRLNFLDHENSNILVLLFIFFGSIVSIKIIANLILLVLVFIGAMRVFNEKINPFSNSSTRLLSYLFMQYFLVMLFSIILSTGFGQELNHIFRKIHFFLAPLILVAFYGININVKNVIFWLKITSISSFFAVVVHMIYIAIHPTLYVDLGLTQISGMLNANIFGDIVSIVVISSIIDIFNENKRELIYSFLSITLGSVALLASGSRGSWIVFAILIILFIIFSYRKIGSFISKKRKFIIALTSFYLLFISIFLNALNTGFARTLNEIDSFNQSSSQASSMSLRFDMWTSSLEALKDIPWHGYGYRLANREVAKYSENFSENITKFTHLHNEYITNLLSAGYLGLISLLLLVFVPLVFFIKNRKQDDCNLASIIGIFVCLGYSLIGFTHIAFGEEHINALYVSLISLLVLIVNKNKLYSLKKLKS